MPVSQRLRGFLRANLLGLVAIFIALGGVASALPGSGTIDHDDLQGHAVHTNKIHAGAVTTSRLDSGAVTTPKLGEGAVASSKLAGDAVNSAKVLNDSLTGDDIDEATLAGVDAASLGGQPKGAFGAGVMMARINDLPSSTTGSPSQSFGSPTGTSTGDPTEGNRTMIAPTAIVARDLRVKLTSATTGRSFTLRVNGSVTPLSCDIPQLGSTCSNTTDAVAIPAGAELSIESVEAGFFGLPHNAMVSWRATMP